MPAYTSGQLHGLRHHTKPPRAVRQALFRHRIWLPREQRAVRSADASVCDVDKHCTTALLEPTKIHVGTQSSGGQTTCLPPSTDARRGSTSFALLNANSIGNKFSTINTVISEGGIDVMLLTETWHTTCQDTALRRCIPAGYSCIDLPRPNAPIVGTNHGGIAAIISEAFTHKVIAPPIQPSSFESLCFSLTGSSSTVVILLIYRPGSTIPTNEFFTELTRFMEVLALYKCQIVIAGDLNIHIEDPSDAHAARLLDIISHFDCTQHVPLCSTHHAGGTLDLVITKSEQVLNSLVVDPPDALSDHSLIHWSLPLWHQPPISRLREIRGWAKVDRGSFRSALLESVLCAPGKLPATSDECFDVYHGTLKSLADRFAPVRRVLVRRQLLTGWMDHECRQLRRHSRMLERRYRRSKLASDRLAWVMHERLRHQTYRAKENDFWTRRIHEHRGRPSKLWRSMSQVLGRTRAGQCKVKPSAQEFMDFFLEKVRAVRSATGRLDVQSDLPPATEILTDFDAYSCDDVASVIRESASKSCSLDPLPTPVLKEFLPELLPFITSMCNKSLQEGHLPTSQRHAIVTPRLKKPGADVADKTNYRPISNLTFLSKITERMVCRQLVRFLEENGLLPSLQSAYRRNHSTETAVLKLLSDVLTAFDRGEVTLLSLLDMSAAFDTVDHDILLKRLDTSYGIRGTALSWISSFVHDRSQTVVSAGQQSDTAPVTCGVPQGSVLGPVLFLLYTADVLLIAKKHGVSALSYADDTQLYLQGRAGVMTARLPSLVSCIEEIDRWMCANRLRLNASKTQFIWLGSRQQLPKLGCHTMHLDGTSIQFEKEVVCLGVLLDPELSMGPHICRMTRRCFYHLRQIRSIRKSLTRASTTLLIHAFVSSCVDYCNSILHGVSATRLDKVQSILNAAARVITGKRKYDHITATLRDELHWLPIQQRIQFRQCTMVYRSLHQAAPSYISDMCVPVASIRGCQHLRSATQGKLVVPRTATASFGRRSFAVSGPSYWNALSISARNATLTLSQFRTNLKTDLFREAYC